MSDSGKLYSAFVGSKRIKRGGIEQVVLACKSYIDNNELQRIAIFDEDVGSVVDIDYSGTKEEVLERLWRRFCPQPTPIPEAPKLSVKPRGRGRPKLGVVSREVSLLPRHWQWLSEQSGGNSAILRKLVEQAKRADGEESAKRRILSAAHSFMWDIAGDLRHFEDASRALYAKEYAAFEALIAGWPEDIQKQLMFYIDQVKPPS